MKRLSYLGLAVGLIGFILPQDIVADAEKETVSGEKLSRLRIEGTKGLQFFGFCVTTSNKKVRKFEGTVPTEVSFDAKVEKCTVEKKESKGNLLIRFTHQDDTLYSNKMEGPTLGIQFVIPW